MIQRIEEYLCLMTKSSERLAVDDPARISFERGSYRTRLLVVFSAAAVFGAECVWRQVLFALVTEDRQELSITWAMKPRSLLLNMGKLRRKSPCFKYSGTTSDCGCRGRQV